MAKRRYSEREVSVILTRTTELQQAVREDVPSEGLTLDEIVEAAREAGFDPRLVRLAAAERAQPATGKAGRHVYGAPLRIVSTRVVEAELTDAMMDDLVVQIRKGLSRQGRFEKLGRALSWWSTIDGSNLCITAEQQGDQVVIRSEMKAHGAAVLLFYLPLFFLLTVGGAFLSDEVALPEGLEAAGLLASMVLLFLLARPLFAAWESRRVRRLDDVLDVLAVRVAASTETAGQEQGAAVREDRDDVAARRSLPEEVETGSSGRGQRRKLFN